jgi:hypothetical protein
MGRMLVAPVVLAAAVTACGGARSLGPNDAPAAAGTVAPTPVAAAIATPTAVGPAATDTLASKPADAEPPVDSSAGTSSQLSTGEASQLLDEVDDILRQLDGELAADADAVTNSEE